MSKKSIAIGIAAATVAVSVLALSKRTSAGQKFTDATSRLWTATPLRRAESVRRAQT